MSITPAQYVWQNGSLVEWSDATVHVLAHGLHYGSSVFEGIRAYDTPDGPTVFRLNAHIRRMYDSAKIYGMRLPIEPEDLADACKAVVSANGFTNAYIRPIAYRGFGSLTLNGQGTPIEIAVGAFEWDSLLGQRALEQGADVCVSSWVRAAPNAMPAAAKAGGHYLASQLVAQEAARNGCDEGIMLDAMGHISEGAGENLFLVRDGVLYTPPTAASILPGVTRDAAMKLARAAGLEVVETHLARTSLYTADELFFTGTACEITPIRSIDSIPVGTGRPGEITRYIQDAFFGLFAGTTEDTWGWLDPVAARQPARRSEQDTVRRFVDDPTTGRRVRVADANRPRPDWPKDPCPW